LGLVFVWVSDLDVEQDGRKRERTGEREKAYISETGATFIDVPMTMIRSTMAASCSVSLSKKRPGSFSPKKVMLGWTHQLWNTRKNMFTLTFITPG
jgi:hypothetical protein